MPTFYLSVGDYVKAYKGQVSSSEDPDYHVAEFDIGHAWPFKKAIEIAGSPRSEQGARRRWRVSM